MTTNPVEQTSKTRKKKDGLSASQRQKLATSSVQKYSLYLPLRAAKELADEAKARGREPLEVIYDRYHAGREAGERLVRVEETLEALTKLIRLILVDTATASAHVRSAGIPPERAEKVAALVAERTLEASEILRSLEPGSLR